VKPKGKTPFLETPAVKRPSSDRALCILFKFMCVCDMTLLEFSNVFLEVICSSSIPHSRPVNRYCTVAMNIPVNVSG